MISTTWKTGLLIFIILLNFTLSTEGQYSNRKISKKQLAYTDSLKQVEYNHIFPFLGQQAYKRGFDIPYPAGLMVNYIWMEQGLILENFQLGVQSESVDLPLWK